MPHLFEADVEAIADGVAKLREQRSSADELPDYADLNTRLSYG
jgi:hypothetical protein